MDHLLTCDCGKENVVSKKQAGQEITCECGNSLRIPTLRGFSDLKPASTPKIEESRAPRWKGWRGTVFASSLGLAIIAGLFSGFFFLQNEYVDTPYTVDQYIAEGNEVMDLYGPDELSILWNDFESIGLRTRMPPEFHYQRIFARELRIKSMIAAGVAAFFALIAAIVWFTTKRTS